MQKIRRLGGLERKGRRERREEGGEKEKKVLK